MLRILLNFYYKLPHDNTFGILSKILNRGGAKTIKYFLDFFIPKYFLRTISYHQIGINTNISRNRKIIISLTSFPKRIEDVWIVVECLLRQSCKPDAIILWLSKTQFEGLSLPNSLINQIPRGLTIRFVEDDLKSHKKYIYAFDLFPNDYIITVDDDLYYDDCLIENLIDLKTKFPNSIPTNRCHRIAFYENGEIKNYRKWFHNSTESKPSFFLVPTGGFGTLYLRQDLSDSYNDIALIKGIIPYADDLWMKIQTLLANKTVVTNDKYNKDPITVKNSQLENLVKINVKGGGNDEQFKAVLDFYDINGQDFFLKKENVLC
jgi:hypothetical protein